MQATTAKMANVNGTGGRSTVAENGLAELEAARELARRHGLAYVEPDELRIDPDLFHSVPFDLMLRYG